MEQHRDISGVIKMIGCSAVPTESLIGRWKMRLRAGMKKLITRKTKLRKNKKNNLTRSIDSGLGSDLSSNYNEDLPSIFSGSSSPASILRSAQTSPSFKKKISFSEPEDTSRKYVTLEDRNSHEIPTNVSIMKAEVVSVSSQLGNIYREALHQVSLHSGSVYEACASVLLTPLPPPIPTVSLLHNISTVLSADLSTLPDSILAIILSKLHLTIITIITCTHLSQDNKDTRDKMSEVVRECQERNYQDTAWCVARTRQIWLSLYKQEI